MSNRKEFLLILFVFGIAFAGFSQKNLTKKADKLFNKFQYTKALELYKNAYQLTNSSDALIGIVECYKKSGQAAEAVPYLKDLVNLPGIDSNYKFEYGKALLEAGSIQAANNVFKEIYQENPEDGKALGFFESTSRLLEANNEVGFYEVNKIDLNTSFDDYSPTFYRNGIIFTSDRGGVDSERIYEVTGRPYCDLFFSPDEGENVHTEAELWGGNINTLWHEGTCSFADDFNTVYFTRDNYLNRKIKESKDEIVKLKIYSATKKGDDDDWEILDNIPFNSDEYSVMHPSLSKDGNALYFSSDMPGGYGNSDIYVSYRVGSSWGTPQNLGPEINSEGREVFPHYAENGELYFSSDGMPGQGGLDIFKSRLIAGEWEPPLNLGNPINSNTDDFGFIINLENNTGYLTSRRAGGQGLDDIYTFRKCLTLNGFVFAEETGEALPGAMVVVKDPQGNEIFNDQVDENGKFSTCINRDRNYSVVATHPDFPDASEIVTTYDIEGDVIEIEIPMQTPPPPVCKLNGKILNVSTKQPIAGATVTIQDSEGESSTLVTDETGNYAVVAKVGVEYKIYATADNYYTGSKTIGTADKACEDLEKIDMDIYLEEIVLDEPIVLQHIYYDFDKYNIREDAKPELENLINLMAQNPGITIELSSHTDSRASDEYNLALSQKRAESAKEYMVNRGIEEFRIVAVGYGESSLVNECANGVKCRERKHQENRRTVFTVIGYNVDEVISLPHYFIDENKRDLLNYDVNSFGGTSIFYSTSDGENFTSGSFHEEKEVKEIDGINSKDYYKEEKKKKKKAKKKAKKNK